MQSAPSFVTPLLLQPLRGRVPALRSAAQQATPRRRGMYSARAGLEIQPPPSTGQGSAEGGQVRVRQHVNPLARRWSQPVTLPEKWYATAFAQPARPLVLDVGVAKGRFLLRLAAARPDVNFLGLEIRAPLVHQANRAAADAGLSNLFYVACNANVDLLAVLDAAPPAALTDVYVQFCDPWFKKRHAKRRMVNNALVTDIHTALQRSRDARRAQLADCGDVEDQAAAEASTTTGEGEEGEKSKMQDRRVFLQSDVLEVAEEMRDLFAEHAGFERLGAAHGLEQDADGWLVDNPTGEPTEREIAVQSKGGRAYRALFRLSPGTATP